MPIVDGACCPGCGLANYAGQCPVCDGDSVRYEHELSSAFGSLRPPGELSDEQERAVTSLAGVYRDVDADSPDVAEDGSAVVRVLTERGWAPVTIDTDGGWAEPYADAGDIPF